MFPSVFKTLGTTAIKAIVGTNPVRIYDFDAAPQGVVPPYITWLEVTGQPNDQLSGAPGSDRDTVQIDCYAGPDENARAVARSLGLAVRDALDAAGYYNRLVLSTREETTKLFRVSIEADFITNR
jgi:hypothetical protein